MPTPDPGYTSWLVQQLRRADITPERRANLEDALLHATTDGGGSRWQWGDQFTTPSEPYTDPYNRQAVPYHARQRDEGFKRISSDDGGYAPTIDPDAPDPSDVTAIEDLNSSIHDMVDHWTNEVWPNLSAEAQEIYVDFLKG